MSDFQYLRFCNKQNLNKALVTLKGILNAVNFDGVINRAEIKEIYGWIEEHESVENLNPFNEIIPILADACDKNNIENEVLEDLHWFLDKKLDDNHFYDAVTNDLQNLQGLLHGIIADLTVGEEEVKMLSNWLHSHEHLSGLWPYDEVYSLLISVLQDKKVDEVEANYLKLFFSEFVQLSTNSQINLKRSLGDEKITHGICSVDPNIEFRERKFCFTGESIRASRKDISGIVASYVNTPVVLFTLKIDVFPVDINSFSKLVSV